MTTIDQPLVKSRNETSEAEKESVAVENNQKFIRRHITEDQICVLTFDRPNAQANLFDKATLEDLGDHLRVIASMRRLRGLVLISAKKSIFIAGADIHAVSGNSTTEDIQQIIELGQHVFNLLANLPIPKVAAIHGACMGGGYEVCLACDYRIASSEKCSQIGLPETKLGILPGWGGTTRLPRLIGLPAALDLILAGKILPAKAALKRKIIDEVTSKENLLSAAFRAINKNSTALLHRKGSRKIALSNNRLVAKLIQRQLKKTLIKKTRGHYPAILKALKVATDGISKSIDASLLLEKEAILELSQTEACRNLIRIFFLQERAKKIGATAANATSKTQKLAVIGSGIMGAGIAQWSSSRNIQVILKDINTDQVAKGMATISKLYAQGAKRRVFTPTEVQSGLDRIYPTAGDIPLKNLDLVIEAAVENMELKKTIFRTLAKSADQHTILATNTSALSISELAESVPHPERVIGIHFFNPVHRMQLVEVVVGAQTSRDVVQRALHFVHQIGKLAIEVKDSPGFLVNRILMPYLVEAGTLFEQGAKTEDIDIAMLEFGMPMGPLRLIDEVGVDVAQHVAQTLGSHFPERFNAPAVLHEMLQTKMLGRKSGSGFYEYTKSHNRENSNPKVQRFLRSDVAKKLTQDDLRQRMVLLMVNEAARCLEEGIVGSPEDVDLGMIMGTGFAPFRGGPLRFADTYGARNIVREMEKLAESGNTQFIPATILQSMAQTDTNFYKENG